MDDTPLEKLIANICDTSDLSDAEVCEELAADGVDVDAAKARTMAKVDALLAARAVRLAIAAVKANPPLNPLPWREDDSVVRSANSNAVAQWAEWADAAHISAAVNAAPLLIAEVERLQKRLADSEAAAHVWADKFAKVLVAVEKWPGVEHSEFCRGWFVPGFDRTECTCGAWHHERALAELRRALGLEVGNG